MKRFNIEVKEETKREFDLAKAEASHKQKKKLTADEFLAQIIRIARKEEAK